MSTFSFVSSTTFRFKSWLAPQLVSCSINTGRTNKPEIMGSSWICTKCFFSNSFSYNDMQIKTQTHKRTRTHSHRLKRPMLHEHATARNYTNALTRKHTKKKKKHKRTHIHPHTKKTNKRTQTRKETKNHAY